MQNTLEINLQNLQHNIEKIRQHCKRKSICAMIKADAYGHGIEDIAKYLDGEVEYFGVACLDEAKAIKKYCTRSKIIIFSPLNIDEIKYCSRHNIEIMINSFANLEEITNRENQEIKVHLKLDCGLNRYGFKNEKEILSVLELLKKNNKIKLSGIYTHFSIHEKNTVLCKQHENFIKNAKKIIKNAKKMQIFSKNIKIHSSSSFSFLHFENDECNMIRVGLSLYGLANVNLDTKQVMKLYSHVVAIREVKSEETIGYDDFYQAKKNMIIAIVGMGYADGIDCRMSNDCHVFLNGQIAKIVGKICMDCFFVDITNMKNVKIGDEVVITSNDNCSIKKLSSQIGKSEYEIATSFSSKRIRRRYVNK